MTQAVQPTDLLISPPNIPDPRFRNSVLMITHHAEAGSFALCVNRAAGYTLDEILADSELKITDAPKFPVYWGGPVSANSLWMMHSVDWVVEGTVMVSSRWAMTSTRQMFAQLALGDVPRHFRIVMGYCSWSAGQLDMELNGLGPWKKDQSWLVANNLGPEWLFDQDPEDLWSAATTLCSHQAVDSWL